MIRHYTHIQFSIPLVFLIGSYFVKEFINIPFPEGVGCVRSLPIHELDSPATMATTLAMTDAYHPVCIALDPVLTGSYGAVFGPTLSPCLVANGIRHVLFVVFKEIFIRNYFE